MINFTRNGDDLTIDVDGQTLTVTHRQALTLWSQLSGAIAPTRVLELTETGTRCPACQATSEDGDAPVYEVDCAIRQNDAELDMREDGPQAHIVQGDENFETVTYCCAHCHEPLGMPADIDVHWS